MIEDETAELGQIPFGEIGRCEGEHLVGQRQRALAE